MKDRHLVEYWPDRKIENGVPSIFDLFELSEKGGPVIGSAEWRSDTAMMVAASRGSGYRAA